MGIGVGKHLSFKFEVVKSKEYNKRIFRNVNPAPKYSICVIRKNMNVLNNFLPFPSLNFNKCPHFWWTMHRDLGTCNLKNKKPFMSILHSKTFEKVCRIHETFYKRFIMIRRLSFCRTIHVKLCEKEEIIFRRSCNKLGLNGIVQVKSIASSIDNIA